MGSLDLEDERERLKREQRSLSRKEHGSNNWEKQRVRVVECHQKLRRKRHDFLHKLSNYYATEYNLVAVEDLDVKPMLGSADNSQSTASAAWDTFTTMLAYNCNREGTHVVEVEPAGTTKECASCGVGSDRPLWVREHSCPACGFEMDRDANAALNILSRGFEKLGLGQSEDTTPVETALLCSLPLAHQRSWIQSAFTRLRLVGCQTQSDNVVETGSPCVKKPASAGK